jgi:hypothetical protein
MIATGDTELAVMRARALVHAALASLEAESIPRATLFVLADNDAGRH